MISGAINQGNRNKGLSRTGPRVHTGVCSRTHTGVIPYNGLHTVRLPLLFITIGYRIFSYSGTPYVSTVLEYTVLHLHVLHYNTIHVLRYNTYNQDCYAADSLLGKKAKSPSTVPEFSGLPDTGFTGIIG